MSRDGKTDHDPDWDQPSHSKHEKQPLTLQQTSRRKGVEPEGPKEPRVLHRKVSNDKGATGTNSLRIHNADMAVKMGQTVPTHEGIGDPG